MSVCVQKEFPRLILYRIVSLVLYCNVPYTLYTLYMCLCIYVLACVCAREREREREYVCMRCSNIWWICCVVFFLFVETC